MAGVNSHAANENTAELARFLGSALGDADLNAAIEVMELADDASIIVAKSEAGTRVIGVIRDGGVLPWLGLSSSLRPLLSEAAAGQVEAMLVDATSPPPITSVNVV